MNRLSPPPDGKIRYSVRFEVPAEVTVIIDAEDKETACDDAWPLAQAYLATLLPDSVGAAIHADLDGIGATDATEVTDDV